MGQLTRTLGAVADVAESSADLARTALHGTANLTQSVSIWAIGALSSSQHWGQELWDGRDLTQVSISHYEGILGAESVRGIVKWFLSPEGRRVHHLSDEMIVKAADLLNSLHRDIILARQGSHDGCA